MADLASSGDAAGSRNRVMTGPALRLVEKKNAAAAHPVRLTSPGAQNCPLDTTQQPRRDAHALTESPTLES